VQRLGELSAVAGRGRVRGGAGGVRAGRHPELSGRLPGRAAAPLIRAYADALERYRTGDIKYVKLLDGGIVDNYGLAGFTISLLAANAPYGPLPPREAVKLRRLLFLVVDSGRGPSGTWAQTVAGPAGVDLINATSDTAMVSSAIGSYTSFDTTMDQWRTNLVNWRCHLSDAERSRLGLAPGWNC
jgi:hypothetical protein